jgi:patatin-like phospholipase/acyl hydrolase
LSLDGGGVRGIVELVVLERLEELIGLGWLARWIRNSIYLTADTERALREALGTISQQKSLGRKTTIELRLQLR